MVVGKGICVSELLPPHMIDLISNQERSRSEVRRWLSQEQGSKDSMKQMVALGIRIFQYTLLMRYKTKDK
ncbi:hypothetical protein BgiMline_031910, partial [Biomphalaria glabrata]